MEPVQVERFSLGCLAHASYMIASKGVAAVIDPQRDVDIYLEMAAGRNWKIEYIIETHLHADFVSGHRELAKRTGARIYLGAGSRAEIDLRSGAFRQFAMSRYEVGMEVSLDDVFDFPILASRRLEGDIDIALGGR